MIPENGYCTLAEMKAMVRITSTDSADDDFIYDLIGDCSRIIDDVTNRQFYPSVETHTYDIPRDGGELLLGDDLLELTTLTNGDGTTFTSSQYKVYPLNVYPGRSISILGSSSKQWNTGTSGDPNGALTVLGIWNYHDFYLTQAWRQLTTLGAAVIDTTGLAWTLASGTNIQAGQLLKVDTEFVRVASIAGGALTLDARGVNGSTAATHLNTAPVYLWRSQPAVARATKVFVKFLYDQRFGEGVGGKARVTAAGVVITPTGIPDIVADIIAESGLDLPGIA